MQTIAIVTTRTAPTRLWQLDKTRKIQNRKSSPPPGPAADAPAALLSVALLIIHPPTNNNNRSHRRHILLKKEQKKEENWHYLIAFRFHSTGCGTSRLERYWTADSLADVVIIQHRHYQQHQQHLGPDCTIVIIIDLLCCSVESLNITFQSIILAPPLFSLPFLSTRVPAGLASVRSLLSFVYYFCVCYCTNVSND